MSDDQEGSGSLRAAMLDATGGADPNVHALINGARTRADRIRHRRAVGAVGGSLAAVLTVSGVIVAAAGTVGGGRTAEIPAVIEPTTALTPGPTTAPTTAPDPASQAAVYRDLKALLPSGIRLTAGKFYDITQTTPDHSLGALGGITVSNLYYYDDGHGLESVALNVDSGGQVDYRKLVNSSACPGEGMNTSSGGTTMTCQLHRLPDASVAEWIQTDRGDGTKSWMVRLWHPDGTWVDLTEDNVDTQNALYHVTRTEQALTMDRMEAIVDAPAWVPIGTEIGASVPKSGASVPKDVATSPPTPSRKG